MNHKKEESGCYQVCNHAGWKKQVELDAQAEVERLRASRKGIEDLLRDINDGE
jgi:hypothetical protein